MESRANRAERYRDKAEEVRIIGESMKDHTAKAVLFSVAQDYLALAAMLDRASADGDLPDPSDFKL